MDRVLSVEEISDQLWTHPPSAAKMKRSESEWEFQQFLQEAVVSKNDVSADTSGDDKDSLTAANRNKNKVTAIPAAAPTNIPVDSDDYQAFLKSKLNLACAAVALSRASKIPQIGSQDPSKAGNHIPKQQDKDVSAAAPPVGIPPVTPLKSTTSSSEQSDDDETAGTDNGKPSDAKRVRRMLSNRESARRSRRRKQAHLSELETQVAQLRVENSTLVKRLTDVNQKFNNSAVDNRILNADVETLRAKVKMAEETVKRLTGLGPFFHTVAEMNGTPKFDSNLEALTDASVPVRDNSYNQFYRSNSTNPVSSALDSCISNVSSVGNMRHDGGKMCRTGSMQRVASLERLQKRICRDFPSNGEH